MNQTNRKFGKIFLVSVVHIFVLSLFIQLLLVKPINNNNNNHVNKAIIMFVKFDVNRLTAEQCLMCALNEFTQFR